MTETEALNKSFESVKLNGLTLRNRFIKAGTFEGKSPNGVPAQSLIDLHTRIGQGGVGMTTLAYLAAENNGRLHENSIYMDEYVREPLTKLIDSVHATGAQMSGQLCHAGGFSKNKQMTQKRPKGPSFGINSYGIASGYPFASALTVPEIKERVKTMGRAAAFMKSVGFDAIEIHFGHGYGISQFISPKTNKRTDEYGGSLINRMRFPLELLEEIRKQVGDDFPLLGKISMSDGVPGGVTYAEGIEVAGLLDDAGLDCVIPSDGTSSMNPMKLFHGDTLLQGMIEEEKNPIMKLGLRLVGPKLFRYYPYVDNYLMDRSLKIRDRVKKGAVCYLGGVSNNKSVAQAMQAGFDFVQLGRGLLFDPDFVNNAKANSNYENGCTHCNRCATLIESEGGIRCVLREPA